MNLLSKCILGLQIILCSPSIWAGEVTIGYQTGVEPAKVALADGEYEKATGTKINWRKFDNGAELIRAMASGDVDIGNVGSSIVATAAGRQLPVKTFLVAAELGTSEALIVRNGAGIATPNDLAGKIIAVPFVSTSHYSLLSALKHWGIDTSKVKIINLRISEITAAWKRGDIDAAYVWEPALGKIKETGKLLASSADLAKWGAPTYDLWIVREDFSIKNPDFLRKYKDYHANPKAFSADAAHLSKIARVTGAKQEDISVLLAGDSYPVQDKQLKLLNGPVIKAIADTAAFLKSQGKLDLLLPDYKKYVTDSFVKPDNS